MEPVNKDIKEAVLEADKFLSVTLTKEKLSSAAEKERSLLAKKFKNLITQLGFQNELPGGGKAPPRPPKGGVPIPAPVPNADEEDGQELYDDVAAVIAGDQYYSPMGPGSEGEPNTNNAVTGGENYEVMSGDAEPTNAAPLGDGAGEDYEAMEDDTAQGGQEDYEEPETQQTEADKQASAPQDEEYEMPGEDSNYEVADQPSPVNNAPAESESLYEGVENGDQNAAATGEGSVDGLPLREKERSGTVNLQSLTANTKPENIEGVIKSGFLNKHRKEGKVYIGSKYQKRYCVVRNHVLYYFKDKKSPKQQGYILLPGYKAAAVNKKGREFTITLEGQRSYQFETSSKKETEEWMSAIQAAADAPLSERHNVDLDELRNKQPSGDEDSLHYEKGAVEEQTGEGEEDVYDDTNEELYEVVGSATPATPSQQNSQSLPIEYEISGPVVTAPKPAESSAVEPIEEEEYELPEQPSAPAPPPPRPGKSQLPSPPQDDNPPAVPPPRPTKRQPPAPTPPFSAPPTADETYEVADTPDDAADLPPPAAQATEIELENYEELETVQAQVPPAVPASPVRPPKRKASPPSTDAVQTKPHAAAGRTKRSRAALEEDKGCTCGRKIKSRNEFACGNTDEGQHSRCPCARRGKLCTEKCRCRHCSNTQSEIKAAEKSKGCRCGEDKYRRTKDVAFVSCADVQGKRMTKCPCYSDGKGCDMKCRCVNCGNSFGASNRPFRIPQPRIPGPKEPKIIGCRCGEERRNKDPWFVACFDVKGQRASRCPCYRGGVGCEEYCKCVNCRNCYNASDQADETPVSRVPRLSTISGSTISDLEISHSEEMSL